MFGPRTRHPAVLGRARTFQVRHATCVRAKHPPVSTLGSTDLAAKTSSGFQQFAIGFDQRDRARFHELVDQVFESYRWSEADMTAHFEQAWAAYNDAPAVALSSWAGGAMAALHFAEVAG